MSINDEIRDKEVRVIGANGEQLGVMTSKVAMALAEEAGLDLVKIAPQAAPPVCRIMDYGKYKFETIKREKEMRKNQKIIAVKEIQLSPTIDEHDINTKLNHARKFLKEGNKIKVSIKFRGRQMAHTEIGRAVLQKFVAQLEEEAIVEKDAKMEGRNMLLFLAPKK